MDKVFVLTEEKKIHIACGYYRNEHYCHGVFVVKSEARDKLKIIEKIITEKRANSSVVYFSADYIRISYTYGGDKEIVELKVIEADFVGGN